MKKNNKSAFLLYFLLIFIVLHSCKKHDELISIKGSVFDPKLNTYVINAIVTIASSKIENGNYNPNFQDIATTSTDAGGNFSFEIKKEKVVGYRITVSKYLYFDYITEISPNDLNAGETYYPGYYLYPQGFIKLHVKNVIPFDQDDIISYNFSKGYLNCSDCCGNTAIIGTGMFYEHTTICKTYGNQDVTVSWTVKKNDNPAAHDADIYCKAFDTVSFDINY